MNEAYEFMKEVYFDKYCSKCKWKDLDDWKDPCNDCLHVAAREYSHTPENFEEEK